MPEGPEIWRAAQKLSNALEDRKVENISFTFPELQEYESKLANEKIISVEPRGKAIITSFSSRLAIYSHNQLYGKWYVRERGNKPETNRQLRITIHNNDHSAYLYSASDIEILPEDEVDKHDYIKKLGPDVVHPDTTIGDILSQYKSAKYQNRKITTLLLDQGFLSGVGNYLRSEILFYANVYPFYKLKRYSSEAKQRLAKASLDLSRRSFKTKGITNDPEIVEALKRENAPRSEYRHFVYNRTGNRCYKCGTNIEEDKTGGRKVYFCPSCQAE
ncbi:MAG: endonuclease VIII [Balneolaceae bacterium]|nr:endonuclease VIII [Balneolaceae bacterium]